MARARNLSLITLFYLFLSCDNSLDKFNQAPKFISIPITELNGTPLYNYQIHVQDDPDDSIQIVVKNLPAWLTFDSDSNRIKGQAGFQEIGVHHIAIEASDGKLSTKQEFDIEVKFFIGPYQQSVNSEDTFKLKLNTLTEISSIEFVSQPAWLNYDPLNKTLIGVNHSINQHSEFVQLKLIDPDGKPHLVEIELIVALRYFKEYIFEHEDHVRANSVIQLNDDSYIIAAEIAINGINDGKQKILRIDRLGRIIWTTDLVHPPISNRPMGLFKQVIQLNNSDLLFMGPQFNENGQFGIDILVIDENANEKFSANIMPNAEFGIATSVVESKSNGLLFSGRINIQSRNLLDDIWIFKTTYSGEIIWEKVYGGPKQDFAVDLLELTDGSIFLLSQTNSGKLGRNDMVLYKLNELGEIIWQKYYGGSKSDKANSIKLLNNSQLIILGSTYSNSALFSDLVLFKLDLDGNLIDQKQLYLDDYQIARSLSLTSDNGYIISAETREESATYRRGFILIKLNSNFEIEWKKNYFNYNFTLINKIIQSNDSGYFAVGETIQISGRNSLTFIKYDSQGNTDNRDIINYVP